MGSWIQSTIPSFLSVLFSSFLLRVNKELRFNERVKHESIEQLEIRSRTFLGHGPFVVLKLQTTDMKLKGTLPRKNVRERFFEKLLALPAQIFTHWRGSRNQNFRQDLARFLRHIPIKQPATILRVDTAGTRTREFEGISGS